MGYTPFGPFPLEKRGKKTGHNLDMNVTFVVIIFVAEFDRALSPRCLPQGSTKDYTNNPKKVPGTPSRAAHKIEEDVASRRQNTGHRARNFCDHVMMRFKHANKQFCHPYAPVMMRFS